MLSDHQIAEVVDACGREPRLIVTAPPGSGKTTRLPLGLADAGWADGGRILLTGPRRVAVRGAASRMAELDGSAVGGRVGYSMRGERRVGPDTEIEVMTERLLTRRLQRDPFLDGVDIVILDEFHERSIDLDLALALLLDVQTSARPDLRVVVMSATLDNRGLAHAMAPAATLHFDDAPHPLETVFAPQPEGSPLTEHVARTVAAQLGDTPGELLVFLPGRREISDVARLLADLPADVCPLHGGSSAEDTRRALAPSMPDGRRRVILASAVAQTSVTVPGVTCVIDAGLERRPRYDPGRGMSRLETVRVSAAAARQRAGRAARLGPGRSVRCWSEREDALLVPQSAPESAHADLSATALELAAWGVDDPDSLAWCSPLPGGAWSAGIRTLTMLGLLDDAGRITTLGRAAVEVGAHPRLAAMMLRAPSELRAAACLLAALVESGARGDLRAVVSSPTPEHVERATRWFRELWPEDGPSPSRHLGVDDDDVGRLLLAAYPDRVGRRDPDRPDRVQLSSGPRVTLDRLRTDPYLVVAELHGDAGAATAVSYAPVDRADLVERLDLTDVDVVRVAADGSRRVHRERRYGAVPLDAGRPVDDAAAEALLFEDVVAAIERDGIGGTGADEDLLARLEVARRVDDRVPAVDARSLQATVRDWLPGHWVVDGGRWDPSSLSTRRIVEAQLAGSRHLLDEVAPTHVTVPTGERVRVDYTREVPTISVRLQAMFGAVDGPSVGRGTVPVVVELLSPAGRPLHVTSDLSGFWNGAYRQVRGEMRGRYPKHHWPEDPAHATPMVRTTTRRGPQRRG